MISKEDFNKLWKDSTREAILNQYYYDYIELRKVYSIIKEAREYINKEYEENYIIVDYCDNPITPQDLYSDILEILDKVEEK